jgi:hypothetical protein
MAKRKGSAGKAAGKTPTAVKETPSAPAAVAVAAAPAQGGTAPKPGVTAAQSRKEMLRVQAERKRKQQSIWVAIGGVVLVALIAVGVYIGYRNSLPVVGEETFPTQGNLHIPLGESSSVPYNSTPPSSGPHYDNLAAWGVQSEDVRYEHLVHNLEDAGVVVYYQCDDGCPDTVTQLETVLKPYLDAGRHVVLTRNDPSWVVNGQQMHKDMGHRIALVAWRKLKYLDEVEADTITKFIDKYEGIDHHQGGTG